MNLISSGQLRRIEATVASLLPESAVQEPDVAPGDGLDVVHQAIRSFVLAGGKRIRPQLCLWTHDISSGKARRDDVEATDAVYQIACGWELFHAFLLIHDDLIDEAETRRDGLSLHRSIQEIGNVCAHTGESIAIVAGDLLFSAAMRVFHEVDGLSAETYRRQLRLFSRVALTTGLGQAMDIWQSKVPLDRACERTLLREYHWKTAAYTFEGPMLSGAILAGADDLVLGVISRYALAVGQAYQLQNDLIDLDTPAHEGCDLVQGKRTVTLLRARAKMTPPKRERFDSKLAELPRANGRAVALAEELRKELLTIGAADHTRELIGQFLHDAHAAANDPALDAKLSRGLRGLLGNLREQYFERA